MYWPFCSPSAKIPRLCGVDGVVCREQRGHRDNPVPQETAGRPHTAQHCHVPGGRDLTTLTNATEDKGG